MADPVLDTLRARFGQARTLAERALDPADDEAFFRSIGLETNPLALQVRHLAGPGWRTLSIPRGESERYAHQPPPSP